MSEGRVFHIGEVIGSLTLVEDLGTSDGIHKYKVKCNLCGKEFIARHGNLQSGTTTKCKDCSIKNWLEKGQTTYSLTHVENTNLIRLMSEKIPTNNSSGVKGVYFHKGEKRWRAQITLNGKTITKSFKDFNLAVKQRKLWEEMYHQPIIDKYKEEITNEEEPRT